jgi:hypothetical protein
MFAMPVEKLVFWLLTLPHALKYCLGSQFSCHQSAKCFIT